MGLPEILVVIGRAPDGLISLQRAGKVKQGAAVAAILMQGGGHGVKEPTGVGAGLACGSEPCSRTVRAIAGTCPALGSTRLVLRLTRTRPVCPRFPRSLGLLAHSVRVFYAAERVGHSPGPGVVPRDRPGSFGLRASAKFWFHHNV